MKNDYTKINASFGYLWYSYKMASNSPSHCVFPAETETDSDVTVKFYRSVMKQNDTA